MAQAATTEEIPAPRRRRRRVVTGPTEEELQAAAYWGRRLQAVLNWVAEWRGYPRITDEQAQALGEPMAQVVAKRLPRATEDYPEVVLLLTLLPWLGAAVQVEVSRLATRRRPTETVGTAGPRGDTGTDRVGEDDVSAGFDTPPWPGSGG
jgi:hypothetical protein